MGQMLSISGVLIVLTSCVLVGIILKAGKSKPSFIWALFNIAVAAWGIGAFFIGKSSDPSISLLWWQFGHIGIIFIPIFIFHVVTLICEIKRPFLLLFVYAQGIIFLILNLLNPNFIFLSGVRYAFSSLYYGTLGPAYHIFFALWVSIVVYAHYQLFISYFRLSGTRRIQIKYFLSSTILGFLGGGTNFIAAYQFEIFPFGNFAIPLYSVLITYAILKYRLLDTSIVFTRTGIFIAVYSVVLGFPFALAFGQQPLLVELFGSNWWIAPLVSSTVLATVGPFIYLYIQQKAEDTLLQEQRQYQSTLRQASMGMGQIKDLKRLLQLIVHIVTRAVLLEHCRIFLLHEESKQFILKASRGKISNRDDSSVLALNSPLIDHLKKVKEPIVYEEIKQRTDDYVESELKGVEVAANRLNGALIVPSFIDQKLIAILILGKKRSGKFYTQDDLAVFSILANQAGLAIENAQFYERMKETHLQLVKAEKMATVGTMADGLSHQINNRLHAMGFIAGDALDTIRLAEKDGLSQEMKSLLAEMGHSFSRIEDNVKRGGEIVEGLLKYTRKGSEGFETIELNKLLDAAFEMVQFKIKLNEMDVTRNFNGTLPKIKGNFTQLQEVFFNLIDNAYDAMMQRKGELKEPGYKARLEISAGQKENKLEILVRDNGMGVKEENFEKLFTPFFTTKLSSKKGTGLGLYVIRQIIEENHGGKVGFMSKFKEGSQTRILLPISIGE